MVALAKAEAEFLQQANRFRIGAVDGCQDGCDAAPVGDAEQRLDDLVAEALSPVRDSQPVDDLLGPVPGSSTSGPADQLPARAGDHRTCSVAVALQVLAGPGHPQSRSLKRQRFAVPDMAGDVRIGEDSHQGGRVREDERADRQPWGFNHSVQDHSVPRRSVLSSQDLWRRVDYYAICDSHACWKTATVVFAA